MLARRTLTFTLVIAAVGLTTAACSGRVGTVNATNQSGQELTKRADGTATGNGQTCSWEGTAVAAGTAQATPPSYAVGATFPSLDGCNEGSCSPQGFMCTMRACAPAPAPVCNAFPKCAPGEHVDDKTCTCVLDAGGCNAFPKCAPGQHVDDKTCTCVADACSGIPECPAPPSGCSYGPPVCSNGVNSCGPLVCTTEPSTCPLPTSPDPAACVHDDDCTIVYDGCYCGARPAVGIAKTFSTAAAACETKAASTCALGCANFPGTRAQDGKTTDGGTIGVRCVLSGSGGGSCQTFVE
jgi:hypothetical protein